MDPSWWSVHAVHRSVSLLSYKYPSTLHLESLLEVHYTWKYFSLVLKSKLAFQKCHTCRSWGQLHSDPILSQQLCKNYKMWINNYAKWKYSNSKSAPEETQPQKKFSIKCFIYFTDDDICIDVTLQLASKRNTYQEWQNQTLGICVYYVYTWFF